MLFVLKSARLSRVKGAAQKSLASFMWPVRIWGNLVSVHAHTTNIASEIIMCFAFESRALGRTMMSVAVSSVWDVRGPGLAPFTGRRLLYNAFDKY
jgi:hypothetical protein